jgi:endonuclease/exonuclease/phosphatase family metal-dependent hydrolase
MLVQNHPSGPACGKVVPEGAREVTWIGPDDQRDRIRLIDWCRTVGPVLAHTPVSDTPVVEELAVLSWNVHVGGGDLDRVVADLKAGHFTEGRPVTHFVLLLQEAHRQGPDVPATVPSQSPVPPAIVEYPPSGVRRDVQEVAETQGLNLFYAPAMRNGHAAVPEDRGTAILSTLPLTDLQVIELPFERQRRIAVSGTIAGRTPSYVDWEIRVVGVHVDTALALTRGGPFAARKRQTEALVEALAGPESPPTIVGGDFNTWLGTKEPALAVMRNAFPDTPAQQDATTWRGPLGAHGSLDYVFVRGEFRSVSTRRLPHRFGSDHYPLLTLIALGHVDRRQAHLRAIPRMLLRGVQSSSNG